MSKPATKNQSFWRFSFLVYCAAMLWLLFGRSSGWVAGMSYQEQLVKNVNLKPLYTIGNYLFVLKTQHDTYLARHCFINLTGNVLLFIPTGWLLPKLWRLQRRFFVFLATCIGLIFLVEILQLFTLLGSFDIDDFILNLCGMILGFLLYCVSNTDKKKRSS